MELPLQVSFRRMKTSDTIEAMVRERAVLLDKFARNITSCRVVVELAGQHHLHGNLYEIHLDLTLPGGEITVTREPGQHPEYKDIAVALRDAFNAARRQVEDYVRHQRGEVKTHEPPSHACVSQLIPKGDYGFLETPDGREIYFHRHSVLSDAFDRLKVGTEVTFVEEEGNKGPQASTVKLVGRHGHR